MKTTYIDLVGLRTFKRNQDAYNLERFASLSGGKVTAEQLPSFVDDVVEGYTKIEDGVIIFTPMKNARRKLKASPAKFTSTLPRRLTVHTATPAQNSLPLVQVFRRRTRR